MKKSCATVHVTIYLGYFGLVLFMPGNHTDSLESSLILRCLATNAYQHPWAVIFWINFIQEKTDEKDCSINGKTETYIGNTSLKMYLLINFIAIQYTPTYISMNVYPRHTI